MKINKTSPTMQKVAARFQAIGIIIVTMLLSLTNFAQTKEAAKEGKIKTSSNQKNTQMKTEDFITTILVDQTPSAVFNAINNVRGWWQGEIEGSTNKLNDEFTYRFADIHFSKQKLVEVVPNKKVVWLVTESNLNFTKDKSEWTGTKIVFEISERNNKTQLRFTHSGLTPKIECYGDCSNAWEKLIQQSLFSLITKGKGVNIF
jgi:hypothetical protein